MLLYLNVMVSPAATVNVETGGLMLPAGYIGGLPTLNVVEGAEVPGTLYTTSAARAGLTNNRAASGIAKGSASARAQRLQVVPLLEKYIGDISFQQSSSSRRTHLSIWVPAMHPIVILEHRTSSV